MSLRQQLKTPTHFLVYFEIDRTWCLVNRSKVRYDGVPKVSEKYSVQWGDKTQVHEGLIVSAGDYTTIRKLYLTKKSTILPAQQEKPQKRKPKDTSNDKAKKQKTEECRVLARDDPTTSAIPPAVQSTETQHQDTTPQHSTPEIATTHEVVQHSHDFSTLTTAPTEVLQPVPPTTSTMTATPTEVRPTIQPTNQNSTTTATPTEVRPTILPTNQTSTTSATATEVRPTIQPTNHTLTTTATPTEVRPTIQPTNHTSTTSATPTEVRPTIQPTNHTSTTTGTPTEVRPTIQPTNQISTTTATPTEVRPTIQPTNQTSTTTATPTEVCPPVPLTPNQSVIGMLNILVKEVGSLSTTVKGHHEIQTKKLDTLNRRVGNVELGLRELRTLVDRKIINLNDQMTLHNSTTDEEDNQDPNIVEHTTSSIGDIEAIRSNSRGAGNFACKLVSRLYPELFGPENLRFNYSYHGGGPKAKKSLDETRRFIVRQHVIKYYPEYKHAYQTIINAINESLRRPETKNKKSNNTEISQTDSPAHVPTQSTIQLPPIFTATPVTPESEPFTTPYYHKTTEYSADTPTDIVTDLSVARRLLYEDQ